MNLLPAGDPNVLHGDSRDSLSRPHNSLLCNSNSLLRRRNSLFSCVGNLLRKYSDCSDLWAADMAKEADSGQNSLLIPCITGNLRRDGFAADCALYHAPITFRAPIGRIQESAAYRAFSGVCRAGFTHRDAILKSLAADFGNSLCRRFAAPIRGPAHATLD